MNSNYLKSINKMWFCVNKQENIFYCDWTVYISGWQPVKKKDNSEYKTVVNATKKALHYVSQNVKAIYR